MLPSPAATLLLGGVLECLGGRPRFLFTGVGVAQVLLSGTAAVAGGGSTVACFLGLPLGRLVGVASLMGTSLSPSGRGRGCFLGLPLVGLDGDTTEGVWGVPTAAVPSAVDGACCCTGRGFFRGRPLGRFSVDGVVTGCV